MNGNVDNLENILDIQGDKVHVKRKHADGTTSDLLMTFVHVVDGDSHQLRLVNREDKRHNEPDWKVSQGLLEGIKPADPNPEGAKWRLTVKAS